MLDVLAEVAGPLAQRSCVVMPEGIDAPQLEAGGLERGEYPREVQRRRVGEHEALRERSCLRSP